MKTILNNLFLCTTPFQFKIAKYLKNEVVDGDSLICYVIPKRLLDDLSDIAFAKQDFYMKQCDLVISLDGESKSDYLKTLSNYDFSNIYYASFDNLFIIELVEILDSANCFGFDDGLASIYSKGIYIDEICDFLKLKILKHYTLYNVDFHVIVKDKLVYLDPTDVFGLPEPNVNGEKLVVFLGEEILANQMIGLNFNQKYVDAIKPDYYIPHPRSRFDIDYDNILSTNLIFEDLLSGWLKIYSEIEVYHFSSSVSVHLMNVDSVKFKGIAIEPLVDRQSEMLEYGVEFYSIPLFFEI